jgi:hypothetical protein
MGSFNYFESTGVRRIPFRARSIFEAAGDAALDPEIEGFAGRQLRSQAMGCVLAWIEAGDFSYSAITANCVMMADLDESGEIDAPDEQAYLNELMQEVANAFVSMGAAPEKVTAFMDTEDNVAGAELGDLLRDKLNRTELDDDSIISNYAVSGGIILESAVKVVRGSEVVLKRKRIGRPKRITSLQRAALKDARKRAFTGAAKLARLKSMHLRQIRGL